MNTSGTSDGIRVEFYARSSLPTVAQRRRDAVAGRLQRLAEDGQFSTVEIHTWEKKVPLDEESRERRCYDDFANWAADVGVELTPFFDTRECYGMATGERGDQLVLPALCVAVYRDDELQSVYPHSTNRDARTVMDCLEAIEDAHVERSTDHGLERAEPVE